jgi:hypothetical protein
MVRLAPNLSNIFSRSSSAIDLPLALENHGHKRRVDEAAPLDTRLVCTTEVYLDNSAPLIKCKVARGSKVVEVGIAHAGFFNLCMRAAQLLVLGFEFDLMDLKLIPGIDLAQVLKK